MYHTNEEINKLAEEKFNQLTQSQKDVYVSKNRNNMKKLIITYIILACFGFFCSFIVLNQIEYFIILNLCFTIPLFVGGLIIYIVNFKCVNEKKIILSLLKREIKEKDTEYNRVHGITFQQLFDEMKLKEENKNLELKDDHENKLQFNATKIIELPNNSTLLINDEMRQVVFRIKSNYSKIYLYKDLLNYEVYENDNSVVRGTIGKSIVGGAFFGIPGMLIGGNGARTINGKCNNLRLIIRINDINSPSFSFDYVTTTIDKSNFQYTSCIKKLQETVSTLEYIINSKKINLDEQRHRTLREELEDLKALLDQGIITSEEFENRKKKILND